jgi:hypothetical protein
MSEIERQIGDAADYVADKLDRAVDGVGEMLSGQSGKKLVGGAAVGALAAVVLPVSLVGGALLGAGYAAFRQIGKPDGTEGLPTHDRRD